jgi:hypothetical protein
MIKNIRVFLIAIVFSLVHVAGAVSADMLVTEDSIEPNQTAGAECLVGALYLETVCLVADGNPDKCINMSSLIYGLPCLLYDGIFKNDTLSMTECMLASIYIEVACLACDGNTLKCLSMSYFNFFLPCLYRATTSYSDPTPDE